MSRPQPLAERLAEGLSVAAGKRVLLRCAAILVGVMVAILLLEGAVRMLFRYNTPDTIKRQSLQYEPSLFARHVLAPGVSIRPDQAWGLQRRQPGSGLSYAINARGTRGRTFLVPKPRGVCRIVALGGSSVFDAYATEGRDWPHLLERRLHANGFPNVEVINAGVPGHASFDSLGRLYAQVWTWQPDYLVLYHGWNDIKYWRALTEEHPLIAHVQPSDGNADPFQNYRSAFDWLLSSSQVYVKLRNAYFVRATNVGPEGQVPTGTLTAAFGPVGPSQFRLINQLLVDAAVNIGATPLLVTEASLITPHNSEQDRTRIQYRYVGLTHEGLVKAYRIANDVVRSVAIEKSAPFLDLAQSVSGRSEFFVDHVHTTGTGSSLVAATIGEYLAERLRAGSCPPEGPTPSGAGGPD